MLIRIAQFVTRFPRAILAGALVVALLCGVFGATAANPFAPDPGDVIRAGGGDDRVDGAAGDDDVQGQEGRHGDDVAGHLRLRRNSGPVDCHRLPRARAARHAIMPDGGLARRP